MFSFNLVAYVEAQINDEYLQNNNFNKNYFIKWNHNIMPEKKDPTTTTTTTQHHDYDEKFLKSKQCAVSIFSANVSCKSTEWARMFMDEHEKFNLMYESLYSYILYVCYF